ncbi:MAG: flagellar biosynthesis protein FlhF [Thiovulaceae bacterium]|nr:flagellar biosynthesis protein FlhF [Sulfurimonadaceae bacterium]
MKLLTFSGESPAQALKKVKEELGDEVIVHETRQVRKKTINQAGLYEVIVGVEEEQIAQKKSAQALPAKEYTRKEAVAKSEDVLLSISKAARQFNEINSMASSDTAVKTRRMVNEEELFPPVNHKEDFSDLKDEISKLTDKVKLIQNMFWEDKSSSLNDLPIPPEFAEIYKVSRMSGMNDDHLEKIMRLTLEHMPLRMRENSVTVKRYFQTLLRKMVPVRAEMPLRPPAKKVMMLVGPTGVGKTTSVAKLAARYSYLMDKKYKVGLIVLDTFRIGAVEQLMQYARMMKLGIETVVDPPEFTQALNALSYCDYILIDTMGSSPYDQEKINKLFDCIQSNDTQFQIDNVLVLPSHLNYEDMMAAYEKFSYLGIDTVMFTKLDETKGFGTIFSFLNDIDKPVSYFSIGQEVPEDLKVANSDYLVDCLLNGFDKANYE